MYVANCNCASGDMCGINNCGRTNPATHIFAAWLTVKVHLITNSVATFLDHPEQLERLRSESALAESAVEECLRYCGPVHSTKPFYAREDVEWHGVTIPKGSMVMPWLGAANSDPRAFEKPEVFDIARSPNRHLGFFQGLHFCLGASLARMEARVERGSRRRDPVCSESPRLGGSGPLESGAGLRAH